VALAAAAALVHAGCTPVARETAGSGAVVYVASAAEGTVARLDATSGRPVGPALRADPAGPRPTQVIPVAGGGLLAVSPDAVGEGVYVATEGSRELRPVRLEPGAQVSLAAGGAGTDAVVAYRPTAGSAASQGCRLVLLDLAAGSARRAQDGCAEGEELTGLALAGGPRGPVAYLGLWRAGQAGSTGPGQPGGRLVEVEPLTGVRRALLTTEGLPALLAVAGAEGSRRLYFVETVPGPPSDAAGDWRDLDPRVTRAQLVTLDLDARMPEAIYPLPQVPAALTVAPDAGRVYLLAHQHSLAGTLTSLVSVDLATGTVGQPVRLAGLGVSVAATEEHVFVPRVDGAEVWVVDVRRWRLTRTLPVGRQPVGVAVGGHARRPARAATAL
jgi:hypothetical protein